MLEVRVSGRVKFRVKDRVVVVFWITIRDKLLFLVTFQCRVQVYVCSKYDQNSDVLFRAWCEYCIDVYPTWFFFYLNNLERRFVYPLAIYLLSFIHISCVCNDDKTVVSWIDKYVYKKFTKNMFSTSMNVFQLSLWFTMFKISWTFFSSVSLLFLILLTSSTRTFSRLLLI